MFYTQSTVTVMSGQSCSGVSKEVTWCFTPSQPLQLCQGNPAVELWNYRSNRNLDYLIHHPLNTLLMYCVCRHQPATVVTCQNRRVLSPPPPPPDPADSVCRSLSLCRSIYPPLCAGSPSVGSSPTHPQFVCSLPCCSVWEQLSRSVVADQ